MEVETEDLSQEGWELYFRGEDAKGQEQMWCYNEAESVFQSILEETRDAGQCISAVRGLFRLVVSSADAAVLYEEGLRKLECFYPAREDDIYRRLEKALLAFDLHIAYADFVSITDPLRADEIEFEAIVETRSVYHAYGREI